MNHKKLFFFAFLLIFSISGYSFAQESGTEDNIISYTVDPAKQDIGFYWKDDSGRLLNSIQRLKDYVESKNRTLVFAMNGGMYRPDYSPSGLFIQEKKTISRLVTGNGTGNFFLKPNGVLYITTDNKAFICTTESFDNNGQVRWATQSGPMLLINGQIHPAFTKGSANTNIRNGVGLLPGNKLVFAMSKDLINFYDFAEYFKRIGCLDALYLDGFVSRTYLPEKNQLQLDGDFGVIIGVSVFTK
ncbi:MAG: phosphodiester glycosidase family protein [Bacteroidetes bacterium]|nr:phosphodiester glycosidase family protein [Bacteroidota bacterium]